MPMIHVSPLRYGGYSLGHWPHYGLGNVWHLGQDEVPIDTPDYGAVPGTIPTSGDIPIEPVTPSSDVPGELPPITSTTTSQSGNLITSYGVTSDGTVVPITSEALAPGTSAPPNTTVTSTITPPGGPTVSSNPAAMNQALQNPLMWMEGETIVPGMQNWMVMGLAAGGAAVLGMMMKRKK